MLGLLLATVVGTTIGALIGANRVVDRALGPTLESLRVLPAAALVPLATLILGYSMQMKLLVVVLPATWPILLNVRTARRSLSPVLMDTSRTLGLGRGGGYARSSFPCSPRRCCSASGSPLRSR